MIVPKQTAYIQYVKENIQNTRGDMIKKKELVEYFSSIINSSDTTFSLDPKEEWTLIATTKKNKTIYFWVHEINKVSILIDGYEDKITFCSGDLTKLIWNKQYKLRTEDATTALNDMINYIEK